MKFIKDYWFLIVFFISFIGTSAVAQYRLTEIEGDVKLASKYTDKQDAQIILVARDANDKLKTQTEKDYLENKREIEKLKTEQKQQTVLRINQQYLIKSMDSMQESIKDLAKEIRRNIK